MILIIIACITSLFFAFNIGASGAAATMGVPYGAKAVKGKRTALAICAIGVCFGSAIGGGEVVDTIGGGIIPHSAMTVTIAVIVLASAALTLFIANLIGVPLSTSEVTVGAIAGVGISLRQLYTDHLMLIVMLWLLIPVLAFIMAFLFGKGKEMLKRKIGFSSPKKSKWLYLILILTGFLEAFSAGMNNVANAVGPLIGAEIISKSAGITIGGLLMALGAFLLGGKVLETNGKRISKLSASNGILVSGTSGSLVMIASLFGIPVPMTQVTTSAIIGIGAVKDGRNVLNKNIVRRILKVWVLSPVLSLVIAYCMVMTFLEKDFYTLFIILFVILATSGVINLFQTNRSQHLISEGSQKAKSSMMS